MKALFVCRGNIVRSQMANGFFNKYVENHSSTSAGYDAEKYSDYILGVDAGLNVVKCMKEKDINLKGIRPRMLNEVLVRG